MSLKGGGGIKLGAHVDAFGTQRAHVQPDGGRAGPAVENEDQRTDGGVGLRVKAVGGVEDLGDDFVFLVFERHVADGGGVSEALVGKRELVRRDDRLFFADVGGFGFVVFGCVGHGAESSWVSDCDWADYSGLSQLGQSESRITAAARKSRLGPYKMPGP
jgi:hypothetical protein